MSEQDDKVYRFRYNRKGRRGEDGPERSGPKTGRYIPRFPHKYKGDLSKIIYRSSWEERTMKYLDANPNVLEWSSEEIVIPYISPLDNRKHRYFPDFWCRMKDKQGVIKEMILEVKPLAQTKVPEKKKRITKRAIHEVTTYLVNEAKWQSASQYCLNRGIEFKLLTEKEIFGR